MTRENEDLGLLGRISRGTFWICALYWFAYALVAPVTNLDSQIYNLSRVSLALRGGLFHNGYFTSPFHVVWPWGFDTVHLPFLIMGWGYALPSFCCLMGTCFVAHRMIRAHYGRDAAWVAVVALLGLSCLVYQGTSTKNDIPILFSGAVWAYARWRWRTERKGSHLFWMILAVGFIAGAKTTGMLYGAILALATLWEARRARPLLPRVVGGLAASFLLLGSTETYVASTRLFGSPLGPAAVLRPLRNAEGIRGAAANLSRYIVGSLYLGPTDRGPTLHLVEGLVRAESSFLRWSGLGDAGMDPRIQDHGLFFHQSGFEELSGFGPLGTLAMAVMVAACFLWRPRSAWWQLAASGMAGLLLVSVNVAYSAWGNRFLICWYACGTLALVCVAWDGESGPRRALRSALAVIAIAFALGTPFLSFNRGPSALVASVTDRKRFETCGYPLIGAIRDRLRELKSETPSNRVFFIVCYDSTILPILEDPQLDALLVTPPAFDRLLAGGQVSEGDLVVEDCPTGSHLLRGVSEVRAPDVFAKGSWRTQEIYRVSLNRPGTSRTR
jgi:hypothetical protein